MNTGESKRILIDAIQDYKDRRVQYRYTRKHPLRGKRILEIIKTNLHKLTIIIANGAVMQKLNSINKKNNMTTINQAAKDYAEKQYTQELTEYGHCIRGFYSGVEFAQRWISPKEELPDLYVEVLVKSETGRISISKLILYQGESRWQNPTIEPTQWRYIELE